MKNYTQTQLHKFISVEFIITKTLVEAAKVETDAENVELERRYGHDWEPHYALGPHPRAFGALTATYDALVSKYVELLEVAQMLQREKDAMEHVVDRHFSDDTVPTIDAFYAAVEAVVDSLAEGNIPDDTTPSD